MLRNNTMFNQPHCLFNGPRPSYNALPLNLSQPSPLFIQGTRPLPSPYTQHPERKSPRYPYEQTNRRMLVHDPQQNEDRFWYNLRQSNAGQIRCAAIRHNQLISSPSQKGPLKGHFKNSTPCEQNCRNEVLFSKNQGNSKMKRDTQGLREGGQATPLVKNGFKHNWQNSRPPHQKKRQQSKANQRNLPENNQFFCDTCDRGYKDMDKYQEHVGQHIKCKHTDCPYIAHPKLVQLHVNLQHRSGLARKIWQLESKEDIQKWRSERKRNFPTTENVARKKEEMSQKIARGEVLEIQTFGKMTKRSKREWDGNLEEDHAQGKNQQQNKEWSKKKQNRWFNKTGQYENTQSIGDGPKAHFNESLAKKPKLDFLEPEIQHKHSIDQVQGNPADPLSMLLAMEEDYLEKERPQEASISQPQRNSIKGALGSLIASYQDSEEGEEDEIKKEITPEEDNINIPDKNVDRPLSTIQKSINPCSKKETFKESTKRKRKRTRKRKGQQQQKPQQRREGNGQQRREGNGQQPMQKFTLLERV